MPVQDEGGSIILISGRFRNHEQIPSWFQCVYFLEIDTAVCVLRCLDRVTPIMCIGVQLVQFEIKYFVSLGSPVVNQFP